jgi:hypothetical protein
MGVWQNVGEGNGGCSFSPSKNRRIRRFFDGDYDGASILKSGFSANRSEMQFLSARYGPFASDPHKPPGIQPQKAGSK